MKFFFLQSSNLTSQTEKQVQNLFQQLNASLTPLPLTKVLQLDNPVTLVCCQMDDSIIGVALLAEYTVISGRKGLVEDVVVDEAHRGKGIGRKLMETLIGHGRQKGLTEILLFTGYHRIPAIRLYESLGFQKKESHMYSFKLDQGAHKRPQ